MGKLLAKRGANRIGKIFNGDFSSNIPFNFLKKYNISESYSELKEIGNINCRITNAVKCLPPNNKPNSFKIKNCNIILNSEIYKMKNLKIILKLDQIFQ